MSVTITLSEILSRARVIATQTGIDANQSVLVDNRAGLRALLNSCLLETYRRKASDQKFLRDITIKNTVAISGGTGVVPDTIMREFLHQANWADSATPPSLITYYDYAADFNSGENFSQLGYVYIDGSTFYYTAPAPTTSYTGNLYVTTPSIPAITTSVVFQTQEMADDVILMLAQAIAGKIVFEGINV